ncbi:hypothetical protein [Arthrobacter sp. CDRTa11]|uniref:hypothetical protein n=1 Tax=Arthrobacter sp. CDRTa11 TaxID=2651199 RepID=UPI002265D9BF|nr:hypothetical protein [Arthrobacter sp. CDRTa11]
MRDESYEAGYRAGHLQGWVDAMASKVPARPPVFHPPTAAQATAQPIAQPTAQPVASPAAVPWPSPGQRAVRQETIRPAVAAQPLPFQPQAGTAGTLPGPAFAPPPVETPAERQARRERRDRQNINITLYVASLLLVAAAALFIGTNLPPMFRFLGVCTVTAMFYVAGFVLHARVARLKPASVAFAGTGLALIPVTGLALYNFVLQQGPTAWLITSLIGTAAYVVAAVRLESRVLVYLSLTFVGSLAWSGVSVLGGALAWYFGAMVAVAVLLTVLALARPGWLPPVYVRPLAVLHPLVVPAVALAVNCVPLLLGTAGYANLMALCGVYFALMAAVPGRLRLPNVYAARISLTLAAAVGVWHLTGRGSDALLTAAGLLAVQAMAVALAQAQLGAWFPARSHAADQATNQAAVQAGENEVAGEATRKDGRWSLDALLTFGGQLLVTMALTVHGITSGLLGYGGTAAGGSIPLWVPMLLALGTSMVLAWRLAGRAEAAPVAALVTAGLAGFVLGAWPLAAMLVLASAFWAVRAIPAVGRLRGTMVLAARAALTLAVPLAVAGLTPDGPARSAAVLFGLLVALVCQQLLTAILQSAGMRTLAPEASFGALAAAGALALGCLALADSVPDTGLAGSGIILQLLAALAIGWLLIPRPVSEPDWKPTVWEAVPLAVSAVAVSLGFLAVSQGSGNAALVLVSGYLFATALRLRLRQHRWAYLWLGRGAATVLALTAFDQLQQAGIVVTVAGEVIRPGSVVIAVLALQLAMPLIAVARRRAPRWILADAGAVLFVQVLACGILALQDPAGVQAVSGAILVALCAAGSAYVLRAEAGAVWIAPVAFGSLLAVTGGELQQVELLLFIFAVFSTVMVVAEPRRAYRGWYFVAARVLTAGLAVLLSYDLTASLTAVSLTFALVLAAQHVVRWFMRKRLAEVPFQQAAVWITLAGQALLPLAYVIQAGPARALTQDDGGRWLVLLELSLLLVSALGARVLFVARGSLYFGVYAALFGVLSLGPLFSFGGRLPASPVLDHTGTAVVLLVVALLATGAGVASRRQNVKLRGAEHWLWLCTAGSFTLSGLAVSTVAADWLPGIALLVLAAVCFTASHLEGYPVFYPPAAAAGLGGAVLLATAAFQGTSGVWGAFVPWLAGAGTAAAASYLVRLYRNEQLREDPVRRWSLTGTALLGLCLIAAAGLPVDATSWASAAVLAAAVGICYYEAPSRARRLTAEVGALVVTAALQRAAIFGLDVQSGDNYRVSAGMPNAFWATQWYVLLASGLGALRYGTGQRTAGRMLVAAGAGLLSLSGLGVIFGGTSGQQLWALVLLAVLLMVGLGLGERLFVWWGAAGVAVCILWAMRHYTFALLALIAVGLIAFAVWRLNRGTVAGPAEAVPSSSDIAGVRPEQMAPDQTGPRPSAPMQPEPQQPEPQQSPPRLPDGGPFSRP